MLGHAARSPELRVIPTSAQKRTPDPKVAVLLNANARRVSERVWKSLTHVVPEGDLFLSRSGEELVTIVQTVLDRRYDTVFCGGGDGTFTGLVNELSRQLEERNRHHPQKAPRLGILKLGTGNGLAALVNASPLKGDRILDDVLRARAGEIPGYRRLDLLRLNGRIATFGGVGHDARILNDFVWVKKNFARAPGLGFLGGELGYAASVAFRTVPSAIVQPGTVGARVTNGDGTAYLLARDGSVIREFAPGEQLFSGKLNFAAAATSPFYGYEFRMFPHALSRPGTMQLRLAAISAPQILANLPALWKGRYTSPNVHDFHVTGATIELDRPMPLQIGGDAEGDQQKLVLSMAEPVELVDFSGAVN